MNKKVVLSISMLMSSVYAHFATQDPNAEQGFDSRAADFENGMFFTKPAEGEYETTEPRKKASKEDQTVLIRSKTTSTTTPISQSAGNSNPISDQPIKNTRIIDSDNRLPITEKEKQALVSILYLKTLNPFVESVKVQSESTIKDQLPIIYHSLNEGKKVVDPHRANICAIAVVEALKNNPHMLEKALDIILGWDDDVLNNLDTINDSFTTFVLSTSDLHRARIVKLVESQISSEKAQLLKEKFKKLNSIDKIEREKAKAF